MNTTTIAQAIKNLGFPGSYTILSTYEKCPAQMKFRYKERVPQGPKSPQAERGSAVHKSIEDYVTKTSTDLHPDIVKYKHVFDDLRKVKTAKVEERVAVARDWTEAEWRQSWIRGVIDGKAGNKASTIVLKEWKTGKEYDDHADQRALYVLLGAVKWPGARQYLVETYYLDLGHKRKLEKEPDELEELRVDFTARFAILESDDILAPRPGWYCSWCPYAKVKGGPCRFG